MSTSPVAVRLIDPRGQRFGAGFSAIVLIGALVGQFAPLVPLVGLALAVSAALGTRWFLFGRPWPVLRATLKLGPPAEPEPELPPRFAQALGAIALALGGLLLLAGSILGWVFIAAVAALQATLAISGYCLGCRLYGLHWILPEVFDRAVGAVRLGSRS